MAQELDNYKAFDELNFNDARGENETREEYKQRLKQNKQVLKLYNSVGRDAFKEMFPEGIEYKVFEKVEEDEKVIQEKGSTLLSNCLIHLQTILTQKTAMQQLK